MNPVQRFSTARVARLATAGPDGAPHVVPLVFAVDEDTIYSCVDYKPKRSTALRRLKNIAANSAVSLLVDHYDDDWNQLWWVRVDGVAEILDATTAEGASAIDVLAAKYPQYVARRPDGPVIAVRSLRWHHWSAS
ncbi:TIGR03668 family PPOX class F420-dependent oxidoreductase [Rhodococcus tibetensis]|uniref:TIGR03668 family PPOX class F420-dependent oxidoreductase n=1 Tax=Rhodococcus tibetensis TaxID=2965064 RepID=A0ABT1QER0_9NOCA|nr:TIGR03668 family PPOX class F420-dependent oxidoreductase [Rhodococcus sp. FXJ9.536]MCQ4119622.1 TIGR03668 family PPOX class F420-dependent oxidoreductase [Rhodococcus sp. FXJ9.536]